MFADFSKAVLARFVEMSKNELFVVDAENIFDKYLAAFPEGTNPIFRERTEHDCQCCKQFVRRLGIVVAIKNEIITTVWGGLDLPAPYQEVADKLDAYVRSLPIVSVFRTKERQFGTDHNYDPVTNQRYNHFHGTVADKHRCTDVDTQRGHYNTIYQVFKRGLDEIKETDIETVLELIDENSLYRGQEHKDAIVGFKKLLKDYKKSNNPDLFIWENISNRNARFRNTVIGTLLTDLAEGKDLEHAVKSFEQKVAPSNYKRPTAIITQRMVEEAVQKLTDLGLGGAIYRRYARLSDVSVNDVLFVDNKAASKMKDGVAALLEADIKKSTPNIKNATNIEADAFINDVLPTAKTIEVLVENRHVGNFVSLTGGDGPERLFKWDNNFAWSYDGNVADSVKQRVKAAGGNINADVRVSLSWYNFDDLDIHAKTPYGHIFFGNKQNILDVDMNAGSGCSRNPVENLAFNNLRDGEYKIYVNQYYRRETVDVGFAIEIEYAGTLRTFSYSKSLKTHENVNCFEFTMKNGGLYNLKTFLTEGTTSQDKWGVKTETLVPVTAIMYSPNHWGDQKIGAKHVIFALENCKNPEDTRGIYNEFLRSDLDKHRKVFEVLGSRTKCKSTDNQISGVGFTAARGDSVTVVVDRRRSFNLKF